MPHGGWAACRTLPSSSILGSCRRAPVRVAAYDGENADPMNGRALDGGVLAYTPWGEIAHALAGRPGYERVRQSDEHRVAPGSETLRALFGDAAGS